jgi:tetratricopeptide (TPR) repeat protein
LVDVLLARQDAAGAVDVLKAAKERVPNHEGVCQRLADAYFRTGQLAAALSVLDELAGQHRAAGRLEAMAGVLRHMSQLAPNNIKVKTRLIETYLQRGFVAEARAELIQRADLEERSGLLKDAIGSLVRAAELSWTCGQAEETLALYKRVIGMEPHTVEHRHGVVAYYLQMQRTAEAAEHQRAIVDLSLRDGRRHEAIAALHQVIGLTPDDTSAYYQLGDLLGAIGEYGQAERVYRRILGLQPDDPIAQAKASAMAALKEQRGR